MDDAQYMDFLASVTSADKAKEPDAAAETAAAAVQEEDFDAEDALQELADEAFDDLQIEHGAEDQALQEQHESAETQLGERFDEADRMLAAGTPFEKVKAWLELEGGGAKSRAKERNRVLWVLRLLQRSVEERDSGDWADLVTRAVEYGMSAVEKPDMAELARLGTLTVRELFTEAGREMPDEE